MESTTAEQTTADTGPAADAERLDPRFIQLRQTTGALATMVLAAVSLVALLASVVSSGPTLARVLIPGAAWIAGVGLLAWHARRWPAIDHRHTSYRLDDLGIEIRRGVVWRTIVNVPRSRVQHTDVSQGPLERRYGLGTLVVYTAGTDYARVSLPGLEHATALRIRERLLPPGETGEV